MATVISDNQCEVCGKTAKVAINDKDWKLHYSCFNHVKELWEEIGKP